MANKKQLNVLVTEKEMEFLEKYCEETGQTRTAVIRELIRKLEAHTAAKAAESFQGVLGG